MTVLIPRTRAINVRLSDAEYLELEQFCAASDARSLSDLVRNTLLSLVRGASQEPALASTVSENAEHVKELEQRIERLSAEIAAFRDATQPRAMDRASELGKVLEARSSEGEKEKGSPVPSAEIHATSESEV